LTIAWWFHHTHPPNDSLGCVWPLTKMDQFWPEHLVELLNYPAMRQKGIN
jgi:hypothetical protein